MTAISRSRDVVAIASPRSVTFAVAEWPDLGSLALVLLIGLR